LIEKFGTLGERSVRLLKNGPCFICGAPNEPLLFFERKVFKRPTFRLGQEQCRENARQHEKGKNLENVLHELASSTYILELTEADLGDDRAQFPAACGDTVRGGAITGRQDLSWDDESGGVGSKVLEEVGQAVEEYKCFGPCIGSNEFVVSETLKKKKGLSLVRIWDVTLCYSPMMMKRMVRMMKPISWMGLRPQESTKIKVTQ